MKIKKNKMFGKAKPFTGELIERTQACTSCGKNEAIQIGKVDYWDIKQSNVVQCTACKLTQLDPMLTSEETAKGCLAYYIEESGRTSKREEQKNHVRNYRRGYLFAQSLNSRGIQPKHILETGPGSGYFCQGIKAVFTSVEVTVMDVNPKVLEFNKHEHGYHTILSELETTLADFENKFDLIIARDILEHVIDISAVLKNFRTYLNSGGYLHFITPNGHEDVWKHHLAFILKNEPSELLINHVNYFDGHGLRSLLNRNSFNEIEYYTYKLKHYRRGKGWKVANKLMAAISTKKSSDEFINKTLPETESAPKVDILNKWYLKTNLKFITRLVVWYQHTNLIKLNPDKNVGHEIYGLFRLMK